MSSLEIKAFVFTDIVGSTRLKKLMPGRDNHERDQSFSEQILQPHRALIESMLDEYHGRLISTQGDGHFLEFSNPTRAVMWAIAVQMRHDETPIQTPDNDRLGVKIGIHMGRASTDPHAAGNYVGTSIDYAARLVALATRGQIVVSEVIATFVREEEISGVTLYEHGLQELRGIGDKRVFEVLYADQAPVPLQSDSRPAGSGGVSDPSALVSPARPAAVSRATTMQQPRTGVRIRDYELLEEIGEGGMGKIFKARHTGMGRLCVLKLIKETLLHPGNEEIIERFYQEIQVVARMKHPNIVQAYHSSSRDDDYHFLVMEYIEGRAVDDLIKSEGRLPVADASEIVRQTAFGLQCIHEHGLVHRDIKPSNLMIAALDDSSGAAAAAGSDSDAAVVKILDLGLALLVNENENRITVVRDRAMGTAFYMAPEQWTSTSVDIRADIYSLGCTLYHMLAGHPPFYDTKFNQEHAHRSSKVPPLSKADKVPDGLWKVVLKMLAKNPEERFPEPQAVAAAIEPFAKGSAPRALVNRGAPGETSPLTETPARSHADTTNQPATDVVLARDPGSKAREKRPRARWSMAALGALGLLLLAGALFLSSFAGQGGRRVVDVPALQAEATHFVLTMPGMNGGWWFDEIPWFFPEVRLHLLQQLTVDQYQELKALARQRDVEAFYDRLLELCVASLRAERDGAPIVSDAVNRRFEKLRFARAFDEAVPGSENASIWGQVAEQLGKQRGEEGLPAADYHLLFLLKWRIQSTTVSDDLFDSARDAYHTQSPELKALCIADYAFIKRRLRQWRDAGEDFQIARTTVPQIELAAPFAIFTYANEAEARLYDTTKARSEIPELFAAAPLDSLDKNHPLRALLHSREALYQLEGWQLAEAEQRARMAYEIFSGLPDERQTSDLYLRSRQFMAMAQHFLGKPEEAEAEFGALLDFIDRLRTSDKIAEMEKLRFEPLKPNLLGRRADAQFFGLGQADVAAQTWDDATEAGETFEDGYRAPYVTRLHFKKAIAYALAGDPIRAAASFKEGDELASKLTGEKEEKIFSLYGSAAAALLKPHDERFGPLITIVQDFARSDAARNPTRDDLQIVLFVCQYVLQTSDRGGAAFDPDAKSDVEGQHDRLVAQMGEDGSGYVERMKQAVSNLIPPPEPSANLD